MALANAVCFLYSKSFLLSFRSVCHLEYFLIISSLIIIYFLDFIKTFLQLQIAFFFFFFFISLEYFSFIHLLITAHTHSILGGNSTFNYEFHIFMLSLSLSIRFVVVVIECHLEYILTREFISPFVCLHFIAISFPYNT